MMESLTIFAKKCFHRGHLYSIHILYSIVYSIHIYSYDRALNLFLIFLLMQNIIPKAQGSSFHNLIESDTLFLQERSIWRNNNKVDSI